MHTTTKGSALALISAIAILLALTAGHPVNAQPAPKGGPPIPLVPVPAKVVAVVIKGEVKLTEALKVAGPSRIEAGTIFGDAITVKGATLVADDTPMTDTAYTKGDKVTETMSVPEGTELPKDTRLMPGSVLRVEEGTKLPPVLRKLGGKDHEPGKVADAGALTTEALRTQGKIGALSKRVADLDGLEDKVVLAVDKLLKDPKGPVQVAIAKADAAALKADAAYTKAVKAEEKADSALTQIGELRSSISGLQSTLASVKADVEVLKRDSGKVVEIKVTHTPIQTAPVVVYPVYTTTYVYSDVTYYYERTVSPGCFVYRVR